MKIPMKNMPMEMTKACKGQPQNNTGYSQGLASVRCVLCAVCTLMRDFMAMTSVYLKTLLPYASPRPAYRQAERFTCNNPNHNTTVRLRAVVGHQLHPRVCVYRVPLGS